MGESTWSEAVRVAAELRKAGVNTDLYYDAAKLEKQFRYAESEGARLAVLVGEAEKAAGLVQIKNLQTREQVTVAESELLAAVQNK
jgi:histidyl-tRNA synthetase